MIRFLLLALMTLSIIPAYSQTLKPNVDTLKVCTDMLYIVDGQPWTKVAQTDTTIHFNRSERKDKTNTTVEFTLRQSDIVSMEILKKSDAAAIYGSRGANGAVLLSTKPKKRNGS